MNRKKLNGTSEFWEWFQRISAIVFVFVGISLGIYGYVAAPTHKIENNREENSNAKEVEDSTSYWTRHGTMGDWTGGVTGSLFSLAGFLLLYLSFNKQAESHNTQIKNFQYDKIESRLFVLITLHRDNVNELSFSSYFRNDNKDGLMNKAIMQTARHRKVFKTIVNQFKEAWSELDFIFEDASENSIYTDEYLKKVKINKTIQDRNINLIIYAQIDLIYLVIFFGVSTEGFATIKNITNDRYKAEFVADILYYSAFKPKVEADEWLTYHASIAKKKKAFMQTRKQRHLLVTSIASDSKFIVNSNKLYTLNPDHGNKYVKYYGGHQFRLGHYFRHLYQSVNFIHKQSGLNKDEKYDYIKLIRGQFSSYEQILFFLNSISQLGRIWEVEDKKTGNSIEKENHLVSEYHLIKNIPDDMIFPGVKLSEFYPDIDYESF
ncbi:hypothetical protein AY601_2070 [Pedobacter cryoconitis]|uniref:Phage abortive infection protein n=1 Tax=Pedobacter cryoconitis TaxID=188932 RepID=A0A127VCN4_9SPHI|nr:putative phage abortive infection protein [Pedobacter cryoconitis]AMP98971.1 hypothetical protein AY601_2070 [Pedobacter cryoconitis]